MLTISVTSIITNRLFLIFYIYRKWDEISSNRKKKKRNVKVPGDGQCRMGGSESHKNGRKKKEEREQNKKKKKCFYKSTFSFLVGWREIQLGAKRIPTASKFWPRGYIYNRREWVIPFFFFLVVPSLFYLFISPVENLLFPIFLMLFFYTKMISLRLVIGFA